MNKRILALILALAMVLSLLTGCNSGKSGDASAATDPSDEQARLVMEAVAKVIPEEAKADVVSYLTDGAVKADTVIMKVGGRDVTAGYYLFWLGRELSSVSSYFSQYGMTMDLDQEFSEGQSLLDYLKEQSLSAVKTYCAIEQKAEEKGVKLSAEQEKQLEEYVASLDTASVTYYGTTVEDQRATYTQNLLNDALNDKLKETGELDATDETMADYVKENGYYNCRYLLFQVAQDADEKTDAGQKAKAQAAYDELSKLSGEEQLKKFQEYQKENPDGNTDEFQFDATSTIDEGFRAKVEGMEVNELGMTDKTGFGYFVLLRLPVDTEPLKESYLSEAYTNLVKQWVEELPVEETDEMKKLDQKAAAAKLLELQSSMNDAAQKAVAAADASSAEGSAAAIAEASVVADAAASADASAAASADASAVADAAASTDADASAS